MRLYTTLPGDLLGPPKVKKKRGTGMANHCPIHKTTPLEMLCPVCEYSSEEFATGVATARREERERCAEMPQPPARLPERYVVNTSDPAMREPTIRERMTYHQAWRDYQAAIRALGEE